VRTWNTKTISEAKFKNTFVAKRPLLSSKSIRLETRKQYVKTFVWAVALYKSYAWTIGKTDRKRIEAFDTWCWRRVLKIKWTEMMRNEEVYRRVGEERTLWSTKLQRSTRWVGHVIRHNSNVGSIIEEK
jgi:hypothetical protein